MSEKSESQLPCPPNGQRIKAAKNSVATAKVAGKVVWATAKRAPAHYQLGMSAKKAGENEVALGYFEKAVAADPSHAQYHFELASAYRGAGRMRLAILHFRKVLALKPGHALAHYRLGYTLGVLGEPDAALGHFRQAMALAPTFTLPYLALAEVTRRRIGDPMFGQIEALLKKPDLSKERQATLHFALARMFDDCDEFDRAFAHAEIANTLTAVRFNDRTIKRKIAQAQAVFTKAFFEQRPDFGSQSELPVFVIGLARSGKSLIERLLGRYPGVVGLDEFTGLLQLEKELPNFVAPPRPYPECVASLDRTGVRKAAERHLSRLQNAVGDASFAVDTLPSNFRRLGLIALLFPRARVICCRREPLDVGLAAYFKNFNGLQSHAGNLRHLGSYFHQYENMMRHWRAVLPMPMLEVSYEALVVKPEIECRRIVEFCGLTWTSDRLEGPNGLSRIDARHVGRWRHYEKYLGPLKEALAAPAGD